MDDGVLEVVELCVAVDCSFCACSEVITAAIKSSEPLSLCERFERVIHTASECG